MSNKQMPEYSHGTTASYASGFILSIILTLEAYLFVTKGFLHGSALFAFLFILAIVQLAVQLVFFLHLGTESKPRWNLVVFSFMLLVVIMIVGGSIWIMKHLDYSTHSPDQTDHTIMNDEAIHH
jgi:cytochrome o ubiquinol oxidase operon protein cyoD